MSKRQLFMYCTKFIYFKDLILKLDSQNKVSIHNLAFKKSV